MNLLFLMASALLLPMAAGMQTPKNQSFSSAGNGFHLREESFSATQSFVYTAKAHFVSGQAGGLVFGAAENEKALVFNVDRKENRTKLLSFSWGADGVKATELATERFIGGENLLEGEAAMIAPRLAGLEDFYFKVVITASENKVYGEFFLDNIKRFGVDSKIDLTNYGYAGGRLGFNTFASEISFEEVTIGESDYSYYSEPYRNQYHYSQFSHWNNDPNGMVYYQGYYHLYYQTNPYGKMWGDMYWGHARSRDLLHWQELPIALYPDNGTLGFGTGSGYAWSGSAFVYHKGMSKAIDDQNWFPNGNGEGLIFAYTRDGSYAQDQIIASSDDGGMTFTRRALVPQSLYKGGPKVDLRDPKIVQLGQNDFLMVVSSQAENRVVFLRSNDLLSWHNAGGFNYPRPECVDILNVTANNGEKKTILTFMGREYIVGEFVCDASSIRFIDQDGVDLSSLSMSHGLPMDYARDRYATQSFVIDDLHCPNYGKAISMSWWSGVPGEVEAIESGSLASFRSSWNGGGQTMPTEEGLLYEDGRYVLSETPITYLNQDIAKKNVVNGDFTLDASSPNPLKDVDTSALELNASFDIVPGSSLEFHVSESENEWIGIGYSEERGYYVDRRHGPEASKSLRAYERVYQTGPMNGKTHIDFKILVDHGGVEVYADNGKYPFYVLGVASPTSRGASLSVKGSATGHIEANAMPNTMSAFTHTQGMLYVNELNASLDMNLATSKTILAYDSASSPISYDVLEGKDVIKATPVRGGVKVDAIAPGNAKLQISTASMSKTVDVTVFDRLKNPGDLAFDAHGVKAGQWNETPDAIVGSSPNGDGYLLSKNEVSDFGLSASFHLEAAAAGLIFRASENLDDFVIANVDKAARITKLFSKRNGVIAESPLGDMNLDQATLTVEMKGMDAKVYVNGVLKIETALPANERASGFLGLNVFSGTARFASPRLMPLSYQYQGGILEIKLPSAAPVLRLTNATDKNTLIPENLYSSKEGILRMEEEVFAPLKANASYRFIAVTPMGATSFLVEVKDYHYALRLESLTLVEGTSYRAKLYGQSVTSLTVNGTDAPYRIENDELIIDGCLFDLGENRIVLNGSAEAVVTVVKGSFHQGAPLLNALFFLPFQDASSSALWMLMLLSLGGMVIASKKLLSRKD